MTDDYEGLGDGFPGSGKGEVRKRGAKRSGVLSRWTPPNVTGITAANTSRFAALDAANSRNLRLAWIGESVIAGQSAGQGTAQDVIGMPWKLADLMAASAQVSCKANSVWADSGSWGLGQTIANYLTGAGRVSVTGAWGLGSIISAGGNSFQCLAAGSMTVTPVGPFDTVEVYTRDGALGRDITVKIGSDAAVPVTSTGATAIKRDIITTPVPGNYPILFTWTAGTAGILGFSAYQSAQREWSFWNWGVCGATSANLINDIDGAAGRLKMIASPLTKPDFIAIESGINDWNTSVLVATYQANLSTLASAAVAQCDTLLLVPPFDTRSGGNQANQDQYIAAKFAVGASLGIPVYNIRDRWGSAAAAVAAGFMNVNDPHPTPAGYADWARGLAPVMNYYRG